MSKTGTPCSLANLSRGGGAFAYLGYAAGRAFYRLGVHGLHRIDDEQFGTDGAHLLEDALHARFAEQKHAVGGGIFGQEAVGTQL